MTELDFDRTIRIQREHAGSVDDTTDAILAVTCLRFLRLLLWIHALQLHGLGRGGNMGSKMHLQFGCMLSSFVKRIC